MNYKISIKANNFIWKITFLARDISSYEMKGLLYCNYIYVRDNKHIDVC